MLPGIDDEMVLRVGSYRSLPWKTLRVEELLILPGIDDAHAFLMLPAGLILRLRGAVIGCFQVEYGIEN